MEVKNYKIIIKELILSEKINKINKIYLILILKNERVHMVMYQVTIMNQTIILLKESYNNMKISKI